MTNAQAARVQKITPFLGCAKEAAQAAWFVVDCDSQAEIDRDWNALLEGGTPEPCDRLKGRFGLSWQIVPTALQKMMTDPDRAKATRVPYRMC